MPDPLVLQRAFKRIAEQRIREAMELGAFDNLPGEGRPIPDLDLPYEPDWWVRKWLARERFGDELRGSDRRLAGVAAAEELRERRRAPPYPTLSSALGASRGRCAETRE